jgi:hypothetical protein
MFFSFALTRALAKATKFLLAPKFRKFGFRPSRCKIAVMPALITMRGSNADRPGGNAMLRDIAPSGLPDRTSAVPVSIHRINDRTLSDDVWPGVWPWHGMAVTPGNTSPF